MTGGAVVVTSTPVWRKIPRYAGLLLLWTLFVFGLLETAGYLAFEKAGLQSFGRYGYPSGLIVPDTRLGWRYQPGYEGYFKGGLDYLQIPIQINSDGFRDAEFRPKDAARPRLVVVGDSVVFGSGVAAGERFGEKLQARAERAGWPIEVRNLGINHYTFKQYLALAEMDFAGLRPDALLIGFTLNDIEPWDPQPQPAENDAGGPALRDTLGRLVDRFERSWASRFLDEIAIRVKYAAMGVEEEAAYHTRWMASVTEYWQREENRRRLAAELDELLSLVADRGLAVAVVLLPEKNDLLEPERFAFPRQAVAAMLESRGVPLCDPYAAFAADDDISHLFLEHDSIHLTPRGHDLLAQTLFDCLRAGPLRTYASALAAPPDSRTARTGDAVGRSLGYAQ